MPLKLCQKGTECRYVSRRAKNSRVSRFGITDFVKDFKVRKFLGYFHVKKHQVPTVEHTLHSKILYTYFQKLRKSIVTIPYYRFNLPFGLGSIRLKKIPMNWDTPDPGDLDYRYKIIWDRRYFNKAKYKFVKFRPSRKFKQEVSEHLKMTNETPGKKLFVSWDK